MKRKATILLVEDAPDLGLYEAKILEARGHHVLRCGGSPRPFGACPMLRYRSCALPNAADAIVFSSHLGPFWGQTYRGVDLLRAYRSHPAYGRLPMLVVSLGPRPQLDGTGPLEFVDKFSSPRAVLDAVDRLLADRPARVATKEG